MLTVFTPDRGTTKLLEGLGLKTIRTGAAKIGKETTVLISPANEGVAINPEEIERLSTQLSKADFASLMFKAENNGSGPLSNDSLKLLLFDLDRAFSASNRELDISINIDTALGVQEIADKSSALINGLQEQTRSAFSAIVEAELKKDYRWSKATDKIDQRPGLGSSQDSYLETLRRVAAELGPSVVLDLLGTVRRSFFFHTNQPSVVMEHRNWFADATTLLTAPDFSGLGTLESIRKLSIANGPINEKTVNSIAQCINVERLTVDDTPKQPMSDDNLSFLVRQLPNLRYLGLSCYEISGTGLGGASKLEQLSIRNYELRSLNGKPYVEWEEDKNKQDREGMEVIAKLPKLKNVRRYGCFIADDASVVELLKHLTYTTESKTYEPFNGLVGPPRP